MEQQILTPPGGPTFETIRRNNMVYVDKTEYLTYLMENSRRKLYIDRPDGFGKSLLMSTLEALFSGRKDLFKGLAVENKLDDKLFAPRPVIRMDMNSLNADQGYDLFENSLKEATFLAEESLGIEPKERHSAGYVFKELLRECFRQYKVKPAILIDGYDAPVIKNLDKPDVSRSIANKLQYYYLMIERSEQYYSFIFMTGVGVRAHERCFSDDTYFCDETRYGHLGAIGGFTLEEITKYFSARIEKMAFFRKITDKQLLEGLKSYSGVFNFDKETEVYNPYLTLKYLNFRDGVDW
ncbi:MAG: AAA family ATPase [Deltaproteobacteria bacterium]|jgi:hypothetical protein|nr:AAA family ATPase [Deltaproteobacteria bacterium]